MMKSRKISIQDYYRNLQFEWLTYFLRMKIYTREIDKKKFTDICSMKKEKIDKYALKNRTLSIFTSDEKKVKYINEFLNNNYFPNLEYSPINKNRYYLWDRYYLFRRGEIITVKNKEYVIYKNDSANEIITTTCDNIFHYREVKLNLKKFLKKI